jgi:hypothetical protein
MHHDLLEQAKQLRMHAQWLREEVRIARYESELLREKSKFFREQLQQNDLYRFRMSNINFER